MVRYPGTPKVLILIQEVLGDGAATVHARDKLESADGCLSVYRIIGLSMFISFAL